MARQSINYGVNPNDGTGDTLRNAMDKINDNFVELYTSSSQEIVISNTSITNNTINGNISLDVNGTGTVQTTQGLMVNTEHQNSNSIFYAADSDPLLTIDVQNKRVGINKATPTTSLDVAGDASFSGNVSANASVTLGSTSSDRVTLNARMFSDIVSGNNGNIGQSGTPWGTVYATNINSTDVTVANVAATRISATEFTGDLVGNLVTSNPITINNGVVSARINTETLTSQRLINFPDLSGTVVTKTNGRMSGPYGTAPTTLTGTSTDRQGDVALDDNYVYYCTADYDGSTQVWKKIALSASGIVETLTSISIATNTLSYVDEAGNTTDIDLSLYLDDTNLARIASGTVDNVTGIATFSRDDATTFTVDFSALLDDTNLARLTTGTLDSGTGIATFTRDDATSFTVDFSNLLNQSEANDLTASVTWANVPDANITQTSVTQHQAALSITESQISDLGTYLTAETSHADVVVDGDFSSAGIMATDGAGTYSVVTDNSANWDTAYSWGDHSSAGYVTSTSEVSFSVQTANFNATANVRYGVDTGSNTVTATLPATPTAGDAIFFADAGGNYATNNLTIGRNGNTIMGLAQDMTVSNNNQSVGLFYSGTTWRIY